MRDNRIEKLMRGCGFIYDDSVYPYNIYDTKHRGMLDRFYSWEDAAIYYGLSLEENLK